MSDEQLPDESSMSKRERQKARRQQKLEAERSAARSEKAKKSVATFAVIALVVGALGVWGYSAFTDRQERQQAIEEARANLGELGCTEVEEPQVLPSQHLSGTELASNPPDALYPDRPASSGRHIGSVAQTGVFDKVIDERLLLHNLEHGYVTIYVHSDVDEETWQEVAEFAEGEISGNTEKIIVSRWDDDLPNDGNIAFAAWGARQVCEEWDRGVALAFLSEYHYLEGSAPERTVQPHRSEGLDPDEEEGDVLFPPLGQPADELDEDVMEEPDDSAEEDQEGAGGETDPEVEDDSADVEDE